MKKLLLLQEFLPHYRVDIFNELAKHYDLTVVYSKGSLPSGTEFKTIFIKTVKVHWKIHTRNIYSLAKKFDIVLCMFDTGFLDYRLLAMLPRKFKLIFWGTGVLFDKDSRYDGDKNTHVYLMNAMKRADATVFYCDYPVKKYSVLGINSSKLFTANNTVKVLPLNKNIKKENLLFIGTLYKNKGIIDLLYNYNEAFQNDSKIPKLVIVGEGAEKEFIYNFIHENHLEMNVSIEGGVYDEEKVRDYFCSSIACISPNQAGLSVLKSMGYGVPFITVNNAITGGELFNIQHDENGILFNKSSELKDIILDISKNKQKYLELGVNAYNHYHTSRKVEDMIDGFNEAIKFTLGQN